MSHATVCAVDTEKESRPNPPASDLRRRDFLGLTSAIVFVSEGVRGSLHVTDAAGPASSELRAQRRTVLVTHLHPDHFDPPAITQIVGSTGSVVCDARVAPSVASRGFRVRGLALFEPAVVGDFTVTAVPAVDGYGDPQVSWVVDGGGRRVFHGGDTLWHGWWWQVGRQLGPFDAAFLPINGARFAWLDQRAARPSGEMGAVGRLKKCFARAKTNLGVLLDLILSDSQLNVDKLAIMTAVWRQAANGRSTTSF